MKILVSYNDDINLGQWRAVADGEKEPIAACHFSKEKDYFGNKEFLIFEGDELAEHGELGKDGKNEALRRFMEFLGERYDASEIEVCQKSMPFHQFFF